MKDNDKAKFKSNTIKVGGSYYIRVPPEIREFLNLRAGSNIRIQTEHGKYGPYISLWSPAQQNNENSKQD